jgi:hypothetical protein
VVEVRDPTVLGPQSFQSHRPHGDAYAKRRLRCGGLSRPEVRLLHSKADGRQIHTTNRTSDQRRRGSEAEVAPMARSFAVRIIPLNGGAASFRQLSPLLHGDGKPKYSDREPASSPLGESYATSMKTARGNSSERICPFGYSQIASPQHIFEGSLEWLAGSNNGSSISGLTGVDHAQGRPRIRDKLSRSRHRCQLRYR